MYIVDGRHVNLYITSLAAIALFSPLEAVQIESSLVASTSTIDTLNYILRDLCLDPTDDNIVYAVIYHGVARFTLSPPAGEIISGGPYEGNRDDNLNYSKYNNPCSCTVFGSVLAVAQKGGSDDAIRLVDVANDQVTTLIDVGGGAFKDGPFQAGSGSGGGIGNPDYLTAINSTHLVVCSNIAQIRLIDTISNTISTLVDSVKSVSLLLSLSLTY